MIFEIPLTGAITAARAKQICKDLDFAQRNKIPTRIVLKSAGFDPSFLFPILTAMKRFQASGIELATHGTGRVTQAPAFVLAHGTRGRRTMDKWATLSPFIYFQTLRNDLDNIKAGLDQPLLREELMSDGWHVRDFMRRWAPILGEKFAVYFLRIKLSLEGHTKLRIDPEKWTEKDLEVKIIKNRLILTLLETTKLTETQAQELLNDDSDSSILLSAKEALEAGFCDRLLSDDEDFEDFM